MNYSSTVGTEHPDRLYIVIAVTEAPLLWLPSNTEQLSYKKIVQKKVIMTLYPLSKYEMIRKVYTYSAVL